MGEVTDNIAKISLNTVTGLLTTIILTDNNKSSIKTIYVKATHSADKAIVNIQE